MAATQTLITAEQLMAMGPDTRFELVRGELVAMSPVNKKHGWLVVRLAAWMYSFVDPRKLGVVGTELGFILARDPDLVRAPDVCFIPTARWGDFDQDGFFEGAPDLAVEVLSPDDRASEVQKKVREYFSAGTSWVWIVDPANETVTVYHPGGNARVYSGSETVTGEGLLAEFSFTPTELFRP